MAAYLPQDRHIAISAYEVLQNPGNLHDLIRERMTSLYLNWEGVLGWQIDDNEHVSDTKNFLLFVEFVIDEDNSVPMIYRGHDLYTVGHLDRNRHAFLVVQERSTQLQTTIKCLNHYGIPHTIMHALGDSYPSMEAVAQIRRAELPIGQHGFLTALNYLLVEDPRTNIGNTAFSYLYLCVFVCEGRRIVLVRDSIIQNFSGMGLAVPENLLHYLYGWAAASFILEAFSRGNLGPFENYPIHANYGPMEIWDMVQTWDVIKQALAPRTNEIDMVKLYNDTVDQFHNTVKLYEDQ